MEADFHAAIAGAAQTVLPMLQQQPIAVLKVCEGEVLGLLDGAYRVYKVVALLQQQTAGSEQLLNSFWAASRQHGIPGHLIEMIAALQLADVFGPGLWFRDILAAHFPGASGALRAELRADLRASGQERLLGLPAARLAQLPELAAASSALCGSARVQRFAVQMMKRLLSNGEHDPGMLCLCRTWIVCLMHAIRGEIVVA